MKRPARIALRLPLRFIPLFLGPILWSLPLRGQGEILPVVPNPPAVVPPPAFKALPFVAKPSPEDERRRRPLQVAAVTDGSADSPSVDLRFRILPVLRLPGDARFGDSLTWLGFWLEFRFHPSKAGTSVTATWSAGQSCFFNGALPANSITGVIGANGVWRVPINFDPSDVTAQMTVACQGVETRLVLRRWATRSR